MSASRLDAVYRSILITKFFTKGWGKPESLRRLFEFRKVVSNRDECFKLIPKDYKVTITKEEKSKDLHLLEGHFLTPLEVFLPGVVPPCAQQAHFQVVMPTKWADENYKPMCVHLAGTGDHFFWRRRNLMAKPLIKEAGIGAIILENPFYGLRKPQDQVRSSLHNVSDIFVMGGCLILETLVLLHWCERNGLGPLGVTGLSMGGHMASLAATNWPKPLVLVPCLSWSTASAVFTQGVMSNSINWEFLESQFLSDGEYKNTLSNMITVIDEAFLAGRKFAQQFSHSSKNISLDCHNFNIPSIFTNNSILNEKFDITNPNNITSCNGLSHEENQIYSLIKNSNTPNNEKNVTSLELLKDEQQISDNLYKKITSNEKFELDSSEILELNQLALNTVNPENDANGQSSENLCENAIKDNSDKSNSSIVNSASENVNAGLDVKQSSLMPIKSNALQKILPSPAQEKDDDKSLLNSLTNSILSNIPFKKDSTVKTKNRQALQFMRGVMDEFTHLGNFSVPYDTSLIIAMCAKNDGYVPRTNSCALEEIWPGAEIRYLDAGHVSAYVLHQSQFRSCIIEAFERSKKKWPSDQPSA